MSKPRVFVSSVVEGYIDYRMAARRAILAAGGEPLLVNEDFPSVHASPRNACLEGVESCDLMLSIVGSRGGWTTPSGALVVEEEYEHARHRKIPVLIFIQDTPRDSAADAFASRLSDYVDGLYRRTFQSLL